MCASCQADKTADNDPAMEEDHLAQDIHNLALVELEAVGLDLDCICENGDGADDLVHSSVHVGLHTLGVGLGPAEPEAEIVVVAAAAA